MLVNILREYNINRIFLSCLGLWPFQRKLARCLLPMFYFVFEISYLPLEIRTLYMHRHNKQMIFECLYQISVTLAFLVKLLNQLWYRSKFQHLYETMENHWNIFTNELEVQIMKTYSAIAHKFSVSYSILVYVMMSMFIIIPSLGPMLLDIVLPLNESRPRHFAVYAEYGVDQNKYFVEIFLYTTIMITIGISIMVSVDTMHVACTAHACGLFQIVGQQIENIISHVHEVNEIGYHANTEYELFNEKIIYRKYIVCLKKHQLALQFTFIIMGALLQLMIACYSGQKLMDESQNIFHQTYAAEWYKFSPRLKSLLIITLYRSIVPCKLTAGNLFPLSMTLFAAVSIRICKNYITIYTGNSLCVPVRFKVVRTSVSYFTAFLSLKD
ncbi:hypothetical protein ACFW04_008805 [Cataglyphis niger]